MKNLKEQYDKVLAKLIVAKGNHERLSQQFSDICYALYIQKRKQ